MRICDPLLPVLAGEFDSTLTAAAATTTGFALAYGSTQLFFGPLGDRVGRLPVIVGGDRDRGRGEHRLRACLDA